MYHFFPSLSHSLSLFPADHYDPDYEFLQQDLSNTDQIPQPGLGLLSPLPEGLRESASPFLGQSFQLPENSISSTAAPDLREIPPALPEKKRRGTAASAFDPSGCRVLLERHPSQYDNISEEDLSVPPLLPWVFTPFAAVLPYQPGKTAPPVEFLADFSSPNVPRESEEPPPLPEKKNKHSKCSLDSFSLRRNFIKKR